ncbi:hypothetical protein H4R33_004344 [Dimargaris cristalligena]|nr:hypothetical protein H4R33_004344 [Dimargaris cristalligena]
MSNLLTHSYSLRRASICLTHRLGLGIGNPILLYFSQTVRTHQSQGPTPTTRKTTPPENFKRSSPSEFGARLAVAAKRGNVDAVTRIWAGFKKYYPEERVASLTQERVVDYLVRLKKYEAVEGIFQMLTEGLPIGELAPATVHTNRIQAQIELRDIAGAVRALSDMHQDSHVPTSDTLVNLLEMYARVRRILPSKEHPFPNLAPVEMGRLDKRFLKEINQSLSKLPSAQYSKRVVRRLMEIHNHFEDYTATLSIWEEGYWQPFKDQYGPQPTRQFRSQPESPVNPPAATDAAPTFRVATLPIISHVTEALGYAGYSSPPAMVNALVQKLQDIETYCRKLRLEPTPINYRQLVTAYCRLGHLQAAASVMMNLMAELSPGQLPTRHLLTMVQRLATLQGNNNIRWEMEKWLVQRDPDLAYQLKESGFFVKIPLVNRQLTTEKLPPKSDKSKPRKRSI